MKKMKKLVEGINVVANAVKITIGPKEETCVSVPTALHNYE